MAEPQTNFSGSIDGENVLFVTAHPYWPGSTRVYLNGMKQWLGHDYYEVPGNTTIQMAAPPLGGDDLIIDYVKLELEEE